ncbi:MAG: cation:proton antiporter [bacterium]
MESLTHNNITIFFLAIGILLASARLFGEIAHRIHQPAVLGEILAGILLGPTVLGFFAPDVSVNLFPMQGPVTIGIDSLTTLAIALFLLVAGMKVDLSTVWRQGRSALTVGIAGIVIPFTLGFCAAWLIPRLMGSEPGTDTMIFALFFATALSITALPVVAKILLEINLFRTDLGMIIVTAAILNDLIGWIIFAVILGMIGGGASSGHGLGQTIMLTLGFSVLILTIGRWLIDRILPWIQAHTRGPGGILGFCISAALLCAAFTEWIGIHAIFGAFLCGVALGDSPHLREHTRTTFDQFISFIFAPLFFASIGLKVNFIQNFDLPLVLTVIVIATAGKVFGCGFGAIWSGLTQREAWAIGFGMNARGAMEIILGLLALQAGIIREPMFVALVVMALLTSMTSGTIMQKILRRKAPVRLTDFLSPKVYRRDLQARDRGEAILKLCTIACEGSGLVPENVYEAVWKREQIVSTGVGHGVAIPHARIDALKQPLLALGISKNGVDFNAPDGQPARLIFLIIIPGHDPESQLELLSDISRTFQDPAMVKRALEADNYTELLALINTAEPAIKSPV